MAREYKPTLLIVDDEKHTTRILKINFQEQYNVLIANNGAQALSIIENQDVDVVVTDLKMPEMDGNRLLQEIKQRRPHLPVIIITAYGTVENAVESMKQGAFDYILKPVNLDNLSMVIEKALKYVDVLVENQQLKKRLQKYEGFREIVTVNPQMKQLLDIVRQVASTKVTVLIEGESGTGKELFARAIHYLGDRSDKPFVSINCGAIPEELIESELFGHERGAFTGAVSMQKGKFELADGGTLFLDEIGELPKNMQVKFLRVLEEREFTRVGGSRPIKVDVRFIAATNRDLEKEVEKGNFREDLYYRLKVVRLKLPPLRERKEDIPILVKHFLQKHSQDLGKIITDVEDQVLEIFQEYDWPGNVRELENVVMHAMLFTKGRILTLESLPHDFLSNISKNRLEINQIPQTKEQLQKMKKHFYKQIDKKLEYTFLVNILKRSGGNITRAAEMSHYDRRQLHNLIKKYNLNIENFKD